MCRFGLLPAMFSEVLPLTGHATDFCSFLVLGMHQHFSISTYIVNVCQWTLSFSNQVWSVLWGDLSLVEIVLLWPFLFIIEPNLWSGPLFSSGVCHVSRVFIFYPHYYDFGSKLCVWLLWLLLESKRPHSKILGRSYFIKVLISVVSHLMSCAQFWSSLSDCS